MFKRTTAPRDVPEPDKAPAEWSFDTLERERAETTDMTRAAHDKGEPFALTFVVADAQNVRAQGDRRRQVRHAQVSLPTLKLIVRDQNGGHVLVPGDVDSRYRHCVPPARARSGTDVLT